MLHKQMRPDEPRYTSGTPAAAGLIDLKPSSVRNKANVVAAEAAQLTLPLQSVFRPPTFASPWPVTAT